MRFPFANQNITGGSGNAFRLDIPSSANTKAANEAMTALVFFSIPDELHEGSFQRMLLARGGGTTGSGDQYLRVKANVAPVELTYQVKTGATVHATGTLNDLPVGKDFVAGVVINPTAVHVFIAATDGSFSQQGNHVTSAAYAAAISGPGMFDKIGSGLSTSRAWYGPIENVCFIAGTFPEVSGQASPSLIASIANGSQSLDTLHSMFTGGSRRCRYPMITTRDLTDAWGIAGPLTEANKDEPNGKKIFPSDPIRQIGLRPNVVGDQVSQMTFAVAGDISTATSTVRIEAGTFSPSAWPTLSTVRVRLVGLDTNTVWRDWTTLTTNTTLGTWAAANLTGVAARPEFMVPEFAGFTSAGVQVTPTINSHGLRGVGHNALPTGQSQLMQNFETGGLQVQPGLNLITTIQQGTITSGVESAVNTYSRVITPLLNNGVGIARGMVRMAEEINARFPGYPIQLMTIGKSGESINKMTPISAANPDTSVAFFYNRWQRLAQHLGAIPPYVLMTVGHSSGSDIGYRTLYEEMLAEAFFRLGGPLRVLPVDVPRYSGAGTGANFTQVSAARNAMRTWTVDNPMLAYQGPSMSVVQTGEVGSDPHPSNTDMGQGRTGSLMAWHLMAAMRAVPDHVIGITEARTVAATNRLFVKLGPIN